MAYGNIVCGLADQESWESGRRLIQIGIYSRTKSPGVHQGRWRRHVCESLGRHIFEDTKEQWEERGSPRNFIDNEGGILYFSDDEYIWIGLEES
jgi:hypothetical protein